MRYLRGLAMENINGRRPSWPISQNTSGLPKEAKGAVAYRPRKQKGDRHRLTVFTQDVLSKEAAKRRSQGRDEVVSTAVAAP